VCGSDHDFHVVTVGLLCTVGQYIACHLHFIVDNYFNKQLESLQFVGRSTLCLALDGIGTVGI